MALVQFLQNNFSSLNRQKDPSNLSPGEYALLVNGRIRNGGIQPISLPLELTTTLPYSENTQGVYGFDNFLIVFIAGSCYIKDYNAAIPVFNLIGNFQMSPTAPFIYCEEVPASTANYTRIPTFNESGTIPSGPITLTEAVEGSPAAIVCQDGVTQPFIIFPDGSARKSNNYNQWTMAQPEYIPIGTIMVYVNDKLYVWMKDQYGNYTQMVGSVSGMPFNFVVAVDNNGNKLPNEATGGAIATAYSVDYNSVTCASATGGGATTSGQGVSFYVSTQRYSYLISPNYNNTIFGEPNYSKQALFSTGPNNNFSIADLIGDTAIIDIGGIRSFNSVLQTRFEGRYSPFSAKINPLFGDIDDINTVITQTTTAAYSWADYCFFAVQTIYGQAILVYDTLFQAWVSVDLFPNVTSTIKQFADIKTTNGIRELFFITSDNKFYQYLAGTTATCGFYMGEFTPSGNGIDLHPMFVSPVFARVQESGEVSLQIFMDSKLIDTMTKDITADTSSTTTALYPMSLPFGINTADQVRTLNFDISKIEQGFKLGFFITWNFKAMLLLGQSACDAKPIANSLKQQARDYATYGGTV